MAAAKVAPKITYGLKNLHYAVMEIAEDGAVSYGAVKSFPGAVKISLSPDGDIYEFHADDGVYYECDGNEGYTGDLEVALVPDEFKIDVFGWEKGADGILHEVANAPHKHIALMGQMATDAVAKRVVFYNVFCGRPSLEQETKQRTMNVLTQKMSLTCRPVESNGKNYVKSSTTPDVSEDAYNSFFKAVKLPGAAA